MRPRVGAKPRPDPPFPLITFKHKYILCGIVNKELMVELWLVESYEVFNAWGRSGGRTPRTPNTILQQSYKPMMRDTWHPEIGPRVLILSPPIEHVSTSNTRQNQPITICHVTCPHGLYGPAKSPYGLYGQVQSASKNFACLAWWTDHDNSFIRTPFAKVNIPESGRRDGRNGTIFVAFRAL
jgi:hypothetical protein